MKSVLPLVLALSAAAVVPAQEGPRLLWQPVMEYMVREPTKIPSRKAVGVLKMNPFITYTHLGTDFGFHGPGERFITWDQGSVSLSLENQSDWAGMWHSLAGMAIAPEETMDFQACYPGLITAAAQPQINALLVKATGKGRLKFEIKGPPPEQSLLWTRVLDIDDAEPRPITLPLSPAEMRRAKFLIWTAEPGASLALTSLQFGVQMPAMPFERYVMLTSLAKLARCYTPGRGLVRDRAHITSGTFDTIPASGMFALAVAAASVPEVGLVDPEKAREVLLEVERDIAAAPKARGLLPHFTRRERGKTVIHPGTEFSTVDTSLCYQGLLLGAEILGDEAAKARLLAAMRAIDFKALTLPDGSISHGLKDDGRTLLPHGWKDWGGETALVLLQRRLASDAPVPQVMSNTGHPWQGTGFISELQSLFHPDFDTPTPDAVSKVNWIAARRAMLSAQKAYFPQTLPESRAARQGWYGLSAGEGAYGTTYNVNGVDIPKQSLIHPHYMLMTATTEPDPATTYRLLGDLEKSSYLSPWGMVENISADGTRYLPMISALNAAFEAIGSYHLMAQALKQEDVIYKASQDIPEVRAAMKIFYPGPVASR